MAFLYGQIVAIELLEEEERRNVMRQRRISRRLLRDTQDPFSVTDEEFVSNFRLTKDAVFNICTQLEPHMETHSISPMITFLAALSFFSNGSYQRVVGNSCLNALSQPSVSRAIKTTTDALLRFGMRVWIKFPRNRQERQACADRFYQASRMPHIVGAIDCTHVAIVRPHENEHAYVNRKGYHSINTQIICDSNLKILNIYARYPGSNHDSFIWRNSRISLVMRANFENGNRTSHLIGDSGYPCLPWLLVPVRNPNTVAEQRYNIIFKRTRSCVERCIGVLKGRFRCLLRHRVLHYTPRTCTTIIISCAILHNVALHFNVPNVEPQWDDIDLQVVPPMPDDGRDIHYREVGNQLRQNYININF